LIEAMSILRHELGADLPLLKIAGEGHEAAYVESLKKQVSEARLEPNIEFLGQVGAEDVPGLLRGAWCSIAPVLWYENLPNSVVESFASGCPVVGADIGSLSTTIADGINGLHHRPGDASDLARTLQRLIVDRDLRARLAAGAFQIAASRHSPEAHTERLLGLFAELIGAPAATRHIAMPDEMRKEAS
jgi:glycosyltransferase involved in cell wall biosynthesis